MTDPYPKAYLYRRIVQAKLYMDKHFCEPIHLDHIADEANFSKFHFIRLFKTAYGKTPHQYLTAVRIEKAKLLLQQGLSVSVVCFEVGFDSITSFTGLFKRLVKITPAAYQKRMADRKREMIESPRNFIPNCFAEAGLMREIKNSSFREV